MLKVSIPNLNNNKWNKFKLNFLFIIFLTRKYCSKNSSYDYIFEEEKIIKYKISRYSRIDTILCGRSDYRKKLINRCKYLESLINTNDISGVIIRKLLVFVNSEVEIKGKTNPSQMTIWSYFSCILHKNIKSTTWVLSFLKSKTLSVLCITFFNSVSIFVQLLIDTFK